MSVFLCSYDWDVGMYTYADIYVYNVYVYAAYVS